MPERQYTQRGFAVYLEAKDSHGTPFTVQQSSSAMETACWLFVRDPGHMKTVVGEQLPPALHLTKQQALRLIKALAAFVQD